jgi:hypothetical protein
MRMLLTQTKGSFELTMRIEYQSYSILFDLNVKKKLKIGQNALSLQYMMVMEETHVLIF